MLRFKDISFQVPDVFRSQFFISSLEKESQDLLRFLSPLFPSAQFLEPFFTSLAEEIDQMLLPVITHEISLARNMGLLKGKTSRERYESFFVKQSEFTDLAKSVPWRYPLLFDMIDKVARTACRGALECFQNLSQDINLLRQEAFINEEDHLASIDVLGASDPHLHKRTFLLAFTSGKKVIHKSVDLSADRLFEKFVQQLDLPHPYDLFCMRAIPKKHDYGWIEYLPYRECQSQEQVKNFYKRAGVVLAVADCLNYTDGHFENLIAFGEYPVLLDGEMFFQNYATKERKRHQKKNLLGTMLVQKPPSKKMQMGYAAAFQTLPITQFEVVFPFVLKDQTDEIELRYRGVREKQADNCPSFEGKYHTVHGFINDVIDGYDFTFERIKTLKTVLLTESSWWDQVAETRSRTVLRDTLSYYYLLRRIQRPEACISETTMKNILEVKLGKTLYTAYEMSELMDSNIPYFYQYPKERHLYQGNGKKYPYLFLKKGIDLLREQFDFWDENYKRFSIKILKKHLPSTPSLGELSYYF
jgi:lantibiotic modifying enzyme